MIPTMASKSDSGNDTRTSSESDNSPTPTPTRNHQRPFPHYKLQPIKILPRPTDNKVMINPNSNSINVKHVQNTIKPPSQQNLLSSHLSRVSNSVKSTINTKMNPVSRTTPANPVQRPSAVFRIPTHQLGVSRTPGNNQVSVLNKTISSNSCNTNIAVLNKAPYLTTNSNSNSRSSSSSSLVAPSLPNNRSTPTNSNSSVPARASQGSHVFNRITPSNTPNISRTTPTNSNRGATTPSNSGTQLHRASFGSAGLPYNRPSMVNNRQPSSTRITPSTAQRFTPNSTGRITPQKTSSLSEPTNNPVIHHRTTPSSSMSQRFTPNSTGRISPQKFSSERAGMMLPHQTMATDGCGHLQRSTPSGGSVPATPQSVRASSTGRPLPRR